MCWTSAPSPQPQKDSILANIKETLLNMSGAYVYTGFALVILGFIAAVCLVLVYRRYRANSQAAEAANAAAPHPQLAFGGGGGDGFSGIPSHQQQQGHTAANTTINAHQQYQQHNYNNNPTIQQGGVSAQQQPQQGMGGGGGGGGMQGNTSNALYANQYPSSDIPPPPSFGGIDAVAHQEGGSPRYDDGSYHHPSPDYQQADASYYYEGAHTHISSHIQPVDMV